MQDTKIGTSDIVDDTEVLCRSIVCQTTFFGADENGKLRLSSAAFDDKGDEISLFRHALCENPPFSNPPRRHETDAVAALITRRIRELKISIGDSESFQVDVRPDTAGDQHPSHCIIQPDRKIGPKPFLRLKRRLTEIVEENWPIAPDEELVAAIHAARERLNG